jgi:endo-1,4-beta-mannosidase
MPEDAGHARTRASVFPVGVAYYPLTEERQTAEDWYVRDPADDFAGFAAAGFSVVRVLISWRYFEPQVGQYEPEADRRLARLVAAADATGLKLIVTFFGGDGLAELVDTPWGRGRDMRTDAYLLGRQTALVQRIVRALRNEPAVFAWDLADEAFAARFSSAGELSAWAGAMRDAVREVDVDRPVTMGVDAETLYAATGVDASGVLDGLTFVSSHATAGYRVLAAEGPLTSRPATYLESFLLHASRGALPVLLDGVGVLSLDHSVGEEAAHVRLALYGGLMNGAAGAVMRRDRDAVTDRREPYHRDPREVLVGSSGSVRVKMTGTWSAVFFSKSRNMPFPE